MSLGRSMARLRQEWSLAESEAVLREQYQAGRAWFSDRLTKSTGLTQVVCPECGAGVRVLPLGGACVRGCGWESVRRPQ
jgi:hypothetical protein